MTPQLRAEKSAAAMLEADHASQGLGMQITSIAPGAATLTMRVTDAMLNGHKMCHGGYIFTLADSAFAFACTGSSYLIGPKAEDEAVARLSARAPFITAGRAVCEAFTALGAKRIGLISPYPPDLTEASAAYWTARGFEVARIISMAVPGAAFHPIYALAEGDASAALAAITAIRAAFGSKFIAEKMLASGSAMPASAKYFNLIYKI